MSSALAENKNSAESAFFSLHKTFLEKVKPHAELLPLNRSALGRFETLRFPDRKHEMFTFVNTKDLVTSSFSLQTENPVQPEFVRQHIYGGCEQSHLTLVDGILRPDLSDATALGTSVKIESLAEAAKSESVRSSLKISIEQENDVFASINSSFMKQGVGLRVLRNRQVGVPLQILHVSTGSGNGSVMTVPRVFVHLEPLAELKLITKYIGIKGNYFINAVQDFTVEDDAVLTYTQVQADPGDAWHFSKNRILLKRNSRFLGCQASNGTRLVRHHTEARLSAPGGELELNGVSVLVADEQAHNFIRIHHEADHCTSSQHFKNIINDRGRASFDGTVIVDKGAQLTNSGQLIDNLMLSDDGRADCKPNLMIFADDVKCAHGATVGQLDVNQLFYLKTRGLSELVGKKLLTRSFAESIIQKIPFPQVVKELNNTLLKKLEADHG